MPSINDYNPVKSTEFTNHVVMGSDQSSKVAEKGVSTATPWYSHILTQANAACKNHPRIAIAIETTAFLLAYSLVKRCLQPGASPTTTTPANDPATQYTAVKVDTPAVFDVKNNTTAASPLMCGLNANVTSNTTAGQFMCDVPDVKTSFAKGATATVSPLMCGLNANVTSNTTIGQFMCDLKDNFFETPKATVEAPTVTCTNTWRGYDYAGSCNEQGVPDGRGVLFNSNEDGPSVIQYNGELKDGKYHGQATQYYTSGDHYNGMFDNDKRLGMGTYNWKTGHSYIGEWNHMREGEGIQRGTDGQITSQGLWKNDKLYTGNGYLHYSNGDYYYGSVGDGQHNGYGTYTWPTGEKYTGAWTDGKREGLGTYTKEDGQKWEGPWKNDAMHGDFTVTQPWGHRIPVAISMANGKRTFHTPPYAPVVKPVSVEQK